MPTHTNPFPGMNPYFEEAWFPVHTRLVTYIADELSAELPDDLMIDPEQTISVQADEGIKNYRPDVAVSESWRDGFPPVWQPEVAGKYIVVAEPVVVYDEAAAQRWVEIRHKDGTLVTVIELISPSNKTEEGGADYRRKQRDLIASGVSLVEIDLIRGGRHVTAVSHELLRFPAPTCHHICVARRGSVSRREIYFCPLRARLCLGFPKPKIRPAASRCRNVHAMQAHAHPYPV